MENNDIRIRNILEYRDRLKRKANLYKLPVSIIPYSSIDNKKITKKL